MLPLFVKYCISIKHCYHFSKHFQFILYHQINIFQYNYQLKIISLQADLTEQFESFVKHNESKNIFSSARTPAVLFTFVVAFYLASGIVGVVGLESLGNLFNICMLLFLMLLITWFYIRYSGEHRNISVAIDQLADTLWEHVSI